MRLWHMLVVERDDLAALGEGTQRVEIFVVSNVDIGGDERGAVVGRGGEHA
jgi:hypothetical protein